MGLNSPRKVLVLSPHPDDESLGCGGTIKLLTLAGGQVDVMYFTGGENGVREGAHLGPADREEVRRRRACEARAACAVLGVREAMFLGGPDGNLRPRPDLHQPLLQALDHGDYRSVFCPWPHDGHADHMATYALFHQALGKCQKHFDVWLYEVWTMLKPSIFIAIDATIDAKLQATRRHESQMKILDYAAAFEGLARYRSLFCPPALHAEAFYNCESSALLRHEGIPWPRINGIGH